ncbi:type IV toxin-antitoxin system AbiEi family antitoxin domain-containing protein [Isoptericola variabilis]|uniref:type IV toxin-antitoxin system AbiEi family antitoxin domain-containing protein n=1 Tax=Isoptericola variabilis TaxID=139208 RepID=UPI003D1AA011
MVEPGEVILSRELSRPGLSRALAAGDVERLRYGAYRVPQPEARPRAAERSRALATAVAVHRQLRAAHVLSHETAALCWGLTLWRTPTRTHVVQSYRASGHASRDIARHVAPLPAAHVMTRDGLPVTTLARTVVDCALTMHPLESLVLADSARRRGLDLDEARAVLAPLPARKGRARAAWTIEHAETGVDSAWETWLRYVCLRAGMPRPVTQAPIPTRIGVTHCDLGWPEWKVFAEFDGRVKYRDGILRDDHDGSTELLREKARYEAIREAGYDPVRVLATRGRGLAEVVSRIAARFPPEVRASFRVNPLLPPPP